ncbi:hypothetical protein AAMO2058_000670000 [Amorphochlora amoebiformis]
MATGGMKQFLAKTKEFSSLLKAKDAKEIENRTTILKELSRTVEDSSVCRVGPELTNSQKGLMDSWGLFLAAFSALTGHDRSIVLGIIKTITLRNEFDLAHLHEKTKEMPMVSKQDREIFHKYRSLLIESLGLGIKIFLAETSIPGGRMFCLEMLAIAFFRIPSLCGFLLDSAVPQTPRRMLEEGKDSKETEQRQTSNELLKAAEAVLKSFDAFKAKAVEEDRKHFHFFDKNPSLFEWTLWLQGEDDKKIKEEIVKVKTKLSEQENFFQFVSSIVCHVCTIAVGRVRFGLVPGYWTLVRPVIQRVSEKTPMQYSETMIQCISDLLQNKQLLGFFSQILLTSTDANNPAEVDKCLTLLDEWFLVCAPDMADPIPGGMCFNTLFKAMSILLSSTHFQVLLKVLTFVYMHIGRFYGKRRLELCKVFLEKPQNFNMLFLHWHPEVRHMFHRILTYRLNRLGPKPGKDSSSQADPFEVKLRLVTMRIYESTPHRPPLPSSPPPDTSKSEQNTAAEKSPIKEVLDTKQRVEVSPPPRHPVDSDAASRAPGDPELKNCSIVYSPLNNAQVQLDTNLATMLLDRLLELKGAENSKLSKEDKQRRAGALFEFRNVSREYLRLQNSVVGLEPFEVVTPEYYFDIAIFSEDC